MLMLYGWLVASIPLSLLLVGCIPSAWANQKQALLRRLVPNALLYSFLASLASAALLALYGPVQQSVVDLPAGAGIGIYFDWLASIMLLLINFVGTIIATYSATYLVGEQQEGRFLRWVAFTLGAVNLLVVSQNLVMFVLAWMLTSLGLHMLLTHYPDRPWAIWAARKKFLISRMGDAFLIVALILVYRVFGTFDYAEVFAAAEKMRGNTLGHELSVTMIGVFFALGAMTKSAQFPFHSWLPDTMETPTPVSALMHAGVINAGGFLVIRLNSLITLSLPALTLLTCVGAFTALFAAVVMMTQTSIKRTLAWSTIAQMGFMLLQCGLCAFPAAMLHIVAHSLYKAHAFLISGSVIDAAVRMKTDRSQASFRLPSWAAMPLGLAVGVALFAGSAWLLEIGLASKPGAILLGFVLVLALAQLISTAISSGSVRVSLGALGVAAMVSVAYFSAYTLFELTIPKSSPAFHVNWAPSHFLTWGVIASGFATIFALQAFAKSSCSHPGMRWLYVQAANGFYLDIPARRLTARVWGSASPTP